MRILSAEFVTSVATGGAVPAAGTPVIALVGRSNVGKSCLVNALTRSRIARVGARPGTTRLANIYAVRLRATTRSKALTLTLADLPGYGFARGGNSAQQDFERLTATFFEQAATGTPRPAAGDGFELAGVVQVIDARHPGLANDVAACAWIRERGYPLVTVITKADRLTGALQRSARSDHEQHLAPPALLTSSKTRTGVDSVWTAIRGLL